MNLRLRDFCSSFDSVVYILCSIRRARFIVQTSISLQVSFQSGTLTYLVPSSTFFGRTLTVLL